MSHGDSLFSAQGKVRIAGRRVSKLISLPIVPMNVRRCGIWVPIRFAKLVDVSLVDPQTLLAGIRVFEFAIETIPVRLPERYEA